MLSWPVLMKLNCMADQRSTLSICFDSRAAPKTSGHQNVSIGTTVPKGVEWYLHPAFCGALLGPWTCWGTRTRNRR